MSDIITLHIAVISHIGCVRGNNEDNFYVNGDRMEADEVNRGARFSAICARDHHLLCICDGMGGLEGGERAAGLAVRRIGKLDKPAAMQNLSVRIDSFAREVSEEIRRDAQKNGEQAREGTTLALAYLSGETLHVANVGDSRVYVMRSGKMSQVSKDHTQLYQRMLAGELTREQVRKHPDSNRIDHYLGMPEERISNAFVYHNNFFLCNSDRLFICSDGISDLIPDTRMEEILMNNAVPMDAAMQLTEEALEMGGKDNATVIVADVTGAHLPMTTPAAMAALRQQRENTSTVNTTE